MGWNREAALEKRQANTRDGRAVLDLREATLDGQTVLVGFVTDEKRPFKRGHIIKGEHHWWGAGGLGCHGGDDLVDA